MARTQHGLVFIQDDLHRTNHRPIEIYNGSRKQTFGARNKKVFYCVRLVIKYFYQNQLALRTSYVEN